MKYRAISGPAPTAKRLPPIVNGEVAPILRRENGVHIADQRIWQTRSGLVESPRALNVSSQPGIEPVGIHDGPNPSGHKLGEIHQVKPVECAKAQVRDEQVDGTLLKDGMGSGKV